MVVVATVPTFQPYGDIKEYAVKMFENGGRGIGDAGKDNGVLVVVAVEDRKVGIEVGYDLEEYITDGFAGQTIREAIAAASSAAATTAADWSLARRGSSTGSPTRRGVNLQDVPRDAPRQQPPIPAFRSATIIFIIVHHPDVDPGPQAPTRLLGRRTVERLEQRRRAVRRRRFGGGFGGFGGGGGGGGGGGFGGFGGGRSGGGGASGGW